MKFTCCIAAAGQGTRLSDEWSDTPKALVPVLGRAMLYYSLNAFDGVETLDNFVVAVSPGKSDTFRKLIKSWGFSHKIHIVEGGMRRKDSVLNTLRFLRDNPPDMVMIHDAARPCITAEMIESLADISGGKHAAVLAQKAVDTLRSFSGDTLSGEIDRSEIVCLETPQIFPFRPLLELHENHGSGDLTDDSTLFTRAGETVKVVFHEDNNMKVTFPEDIGAAGGILFSRGWTDITEGED